MNKAEYDSKISELAGKPVTMDNIFIGLIFRCSWWGMADYYEVVGKTAKSLKLREIKWETCSAEDAGQEPDGDPTYRWTRIVRDKDGYEEVITDFISKMLFDSCVRTGYITKIENASLNAITA